MMKTNLSEALNAGLYGAAPDAVDAAKLRIKQELQRAIRLVDAGLLGCIILTELENPEGTRVRMTPYGDPTLVLQTAKQIVRQAQQGASQPCAAASTDTTAP